MRLGVGEVPRNVKGNDRTVGDIFLAAHNYKCRVCLGFNIPVART